MSLIENLIIFISLCLFICSLILTIIIIFNFNFNLNNYNNKLKILENKNHELIYDNKRLENSYIKLNQFYIKKINSNGYKGYKNLVNVEEEEDPGFSLLMI